MHVVLSGRHTLWSHKIVLYHCRYILYTSDFAVPRINSLTLQLYLHYNTTCNFDLYLRVLLLSKLKKKTIFKYGKKTILFIIIIFFMHCLQCFKVYKQIFLGTFNYFLSLQRASSKRCILICGTLFCLPVTNLFKIATRFNS